MNQNQFSNPFGGFRNGWKEHPAQQGITTGLGAVNPLLGLLARFGFGWYNRHHGQQQPPGNTGVVPPGGPPNYNSTPGFGFNPGNPYGGFGNGYGLNGSGYGSTGGGSYGTGMGFGNGLDAANGGGTNQFGLPTQPGNGSQFPNPNALTGQPGYNPHFDELTQEANSQRWADGNFNAASHNPADWLMRSRTVA